MRLLIISLFISTLCFGQEKKDSLDMKIISMNEFLTYINKINVVIMKQFDLTEQDKYNKISIEIKAVIDEINNKRRKK